MLPDAVNLPNVVVSSLLLVLWTAVGAVLFLCHRHPTPALFRPLWVAVEAMALAGVFSALHSMGWLINTLDVVAILMLAMYFRLVYRSYHEED